MTMDDVVFEMVQLPSGDPRRAELEWEVIRAYRRLKSAKVAKLTKNHDAGSTSDKKATFPITPSIRTQRSESWRSTSLAILSVRVSEHRPNVRSAL